MAKERDGITPDPISEENGSGSARNLLRPPTKARQGSRPRRAFFFSVPFAALLFLCFPVAADEAAENCAELPEAQQAACWMAEGCRRLRDAEQRRECLRLAADLRTALVAEAEAAETRSDAAEAPAPPPAPTTRELETTTVAPPDESRPPQSERPKPAREAVVADEAAPPRPARATTAPAPPAPSRDAEPAISQRTVERKVLDIPKRFVAEITALRRLVRDKQLIALDDQLLFEGDVAAESALKLGDQVDVQRISKGFGDRYRVLGPSQRAVTARRIYCERVELSKQSRRRCSMIGRDDAE